MARSTRQIHSDSFSPSRSPHRRASLHKQRPRSPSRSRTRPIAPRSNAESDRPQTFDLRPRRRSDVELTDRRGRTLPALTETTRGTTNTAQSRPPAPDPQYLSPHDHWRYHSPSDIQAHRDHRYQSNHLYRSSRSASLDSADDHPRTRTLRDVLSQRRRQWGGNLRYLKDVYIHGARTDADGAVIRQSGSRSRPRYRPRSRSRSRSRSRRQTYGDQHDDRRERTHGRRDGASRDESREWTGPGDPRPGRHDSVHGRHDTAGRHRRAGRGHMHRTSAVSRDRSRGQDRFDYQIQYR